MSIADDEYMSIPNKFHSRGVFAIEVCKSGSYRILFLTRHISRTADIIALEMARLRRLDFKAYTIENRSLYIQKLIIEHEVTVYIIDAGEPEIGARIKRKVAIIEGNRHVDNLVAQVNRQSAIILHSVDIKRCSRVGRIGVIIDINRSQNRILSAENFFVESLSEQEAGGTTRGSRVNGCNGHDTLSNLILVNESGRRYRTNNLVGLGHNTIGIEGYGQLGSSGLFLRQYDSCIGGK